MLCRLLNCCSDGTVSRSVVVTALRRRGDRLASASAERGHNDTDIFIATLVAAFLLVPSFSRLPAAPALVPARLHRMRRRVAAAAAVVVAPTADHKRPVLFLFGRVLHLQLRQDQAARPVAEILAELRYAAHVQLRPWAPASRIVDAEVLARVPAAEFVPTHRVRAPRAKHLHVVPTAAVLCPCDLVRPVYRAGTSEGTHVLRLHRALPLLRAADAHLVCLFHAQPPMAIRLTRALL